jgi:sugar lactone lactonase YvrE
MNRIATELAKGIHFGEGPRWHEGRLWFSDFGDHAVKSVSIAGDQRVEFTIDDQPSGLGWLPDGDLLIVSMHKRRVLRRHRDGVVRLHADLSGIATFHCNDMVVDAAGRAYVGNFGFDLDAAIAARGVEGVMRDHATAGLALVLPDGTASVAAPDLHFPNGTVITPDGKTLIIGETFGACLTAFDIDANGALSNRSIWAQILPRTPDGICLDADGAVWVANPAAAECVRVAEGGAVLEIVETGQPCYACMLGGHDGKTLFMLTSPGLAGSHGSAEPRGKIMVTPVAVPHAGWP